MIKLEKKKRLEFPKGFFTQPRPTVNMKEALKDIVPIEWSNEVKHYISVYKLKNLTTDNSFLHTLIIANLIKLKIIKL